MSILVALVVLASTCQYHAVHCTQCNRNGSATDSMGTNLSGGDDGFGPMLSVAKSFREGFFSLSSSKYIKLRDTVNDIYDGSLAFSDSNLVSTLLFYCRESEFLAAFVLILAVLVPLVVFLLWCFWVKCYDPNDENNDEHPNKHRSPVAQLVSWGLVCGIASTLLVLASFSIILMVGNERVGVAVDKSKVLINGTLPMINGLHDDFRSAVQDILVTEYSALNHSIYSNELSVLNGKLAAETNASSYEELNSLLVEVSGEVADVRNLEMKMLGLASFHSSLLNLNVSQLVASVSNNVIQLVEYCNMTAEYLVNKACLELVNNSSRYLPQLSSSSFFLTLPNITLLNELLDTITRLEGVANTSVVNSRRGIYNQFLTEVECNMSDAMVLRSESFLEPLRNSVSNILTDVHDRYGDKFTYGLPESQELVERALGDEYLNNWQEFRHVFTIAFSLSLFVFILGVAVAIGRGLFNVGAIYYYDEEPEYTRGSHMAALMLKNLVIWVSIVGVVSSFFFVFIMCLASIVGRACGTHGNYSEVINEVIDNNDTWDGVYPLGLAYFSDPTHPLTLHSILTSCSQRQSAIEAIGVSQLLNLDSLTSISSEQEVEYIQDMKDIPSQISFQDYSVLGTSLEQFLSEYHQNVPSTMFPWSQYLNLEEDIFNDSFSGLASLSSLVSEIEDVAVYFNETDSQHQINFTDLIQNLTSSLLSLTEETDWYQMTLLQAQDNVSMIQQILEEEEQQIQNIPLRDMEDYSQQFKSSLTKRIDGTVEKYALEAAINITEQIKEFTTTSVYTLSCDTSCCFPVADVFHQFSALSCHQLLDGLDVYWISLLVIFITCLMAVLLMMTLAGRLFDRKMFHTQKHTKTQPPYHHIDHVLAQLVSSLWCVLVISVNLWFVVTIAMDTVFASRSCDNQESSCCPTCLWIIGLLFIIGCVSSIVSLRVYQWLVLYRIKSSRRGKVQQIQRYWLARLKAAIFFENMGTFFVLHVPFLAISGSYTTTRGILTPPSFASLLVSLLGILFLLILLVTERGQIIEHLNVLQQGLTSCCFKGKGGRYGTNGDMTGNGGVVGRNVIMGGRNNSIQLTAVNPAVRGRNVNESDHTYEYNDDEGGPLPPPLEEQEGLAVLNTGLSSPLREIDEHQELETSFNNEMAMTGEEPPSNPVSNGLIPGATNGNEGQQEVVTVEESHDQPITEEAHLPSVMLDRDLSDAELLKQRQMNGEAKKRGGAKLARPYVWQHTDWEGSTPRSSVCMSEDSMTGSELLPPYYRSLSHILGYTSTDDSSTYRDDNDSYESDHGNYYTEYPHVDGKQVEV